MVAVIRLAIIGATVGDPFYALKGYQSTFHISAAYFVSPPSSHTSDGAGPQFRHGRSRSSAV